jgi:hypothetical protein
MSLVMNSLMLLAIPIEGSHYIVDVRRDRRHRCRVTGLGGGWRSRRRLCAGTHAAAWQSTARPNRGAFILIGLASHAAPA